MSPISSFQRVSEMNEAFGNPKGSYADIDWARVRSQCRNIFDEYLELLSGLGLIESEIKYLRQCHDNVFMQGDGFIYSPNPIAVRDALCDIQVFEQGAQHMLGGNGDDDMNAVLDGVMTRFIKNDEDKQATIEKHAAKGTTHVYFEGEYPRMVMKSASDQLDAPKGKFLKSASFKETVFVDPE